MEKDIGKIKKNDMTDIVIRIDDFGGRVGLTIREFTSSDRYTGFTKSGTRIPAESFSEFKGLINSIDENELKEMHEQAQEKFQQQASQFSKQPREQLTEKSRPEDKKQKKLTDEESEKGLESEESSEDAGEIEEEVF